MQARNKAHSSHPPVRAFRYSFLPNKSLPAAFRLSTVSAPSAASTIAPLAEPTHTRTRSQSVDLMRSDQFFCFSIFGLILTRPPFRKSPACGDRAGRRWDMRGAAALLLLLLCSLLQAGRADGQQSIPALAQRATLHGNASFWRSDIVVVVTWYNSSIDWLADLPEHGVKVRSEKIACELSSARAVCGPGKI